MEKMQMIDGGTSTGFDFSGFMNDVGSSLQEGATSWLTGQINNQLKPPSTPQPESTMSQYQAELAASVRKNKMLIIGLVGIAAVIFIAKILMKKGARRAR